MIEDDVLLHIACGQTLRQLSTPQIFSLCGFCLVRQEVQGVHHEHDAPRAAQVPLKAPPHPRVPGNVHQADQRRLAGALVASDTGVKRLQRTITNTGFEDG